MQVSKKKLTDNLDIWLEEQHLNELSENTLKQYKNGVRKFLRYLEEKDIITIKKQTMLDYKHYLNDISRSVNSKNAWIISLNKYLKYLNLNSLCLKQINVQNRYYTYYNLTMSDYKRLLRIAKRENRIQDYWIIKTLAMTGIRISELKYFTVENLQRQNENILWIENKGKSRDVPLRDDLARDLRKYARTNKITTGTIFPSPKIPGQMIHTATIWKHLQKIAGIARVKLKNVHPHSFRHLFADVFLQTYSDNVIMLAEFLGHNSLETTKIYTRKTLKQKKEMLSNLDFKERD